jgi:hypothetical protein
LPDAGVGALDNGTIRLSATNSSTRLRTERLTSSSSAAWLAWSLVVVLWSLAEDQGPMTTFSLIEFLFLSTQFSVLSWIEPAWASRILRVVPTTTFSLIEFLVLSTQFPVLSWIERVWAGDV